MLVARYPTEAEAVEAARSLVERGDGATVERIPEQVTDSHASGPDDQPPPPARPTSAVDDAAPEVPWPLQDLDEVPGAGDWAVCAVYVDARRAAVLLGFDEPDQIDDPEAELDKAPIPWKSILIIWAIAMVVLPLAAFAASYYLSGGT